jgi:hypothetical protein
MPAELPGTRPARDDARRFATALAGRKDVPDFVAARGMPLDVVLEQMAEGVIIADPAGCLRWMNPAAARMHGRPVADVPREDWSRGYDLLRVDGTPYPSEELPVARALARGEVVEGEEWVVRRADGSLVRLLGSATPLRDDHGRPLGAVVVMRDVTERARLAQSLHAETTAKERFLAHMSHELRTPVSTVLGYTALLCEGDAGALSPTAAQMVGRIARSASHLRELVDDLLDISRLAAGKVTVAQAEVSLPAIVRDTLRPRSAWPPWRVTGESGRPPVPRPAAPRGLPRSGRSGRACSTWATTSWGRVTDRRCCCCTGSRTRWRATPRSRRGSPRAGAA